MAENNGGPLFCRLQGYHFESALEILKYQPDLSVTTPDGNGPLHVLLSNRACRSRDSVLDALLLAGADPNLQNKKGEAALHLLRGNDTVFEKVSRLIKAGADIEIRDARGQTPLFAASGSFGGLFETLIKLGARLDTRDNKGRTLLHQVVEDTSLLDKLTGLMGVDPSVVVDNKGNTLFLELVSRKSEYSISTYEHLKKLGVDIDQPNNGGKTVLHKMCSKKSGKLGWNCPSIKTDFDHVIQECTNMSPHDIDGIQPLHIASAVSETYVFKLLESGADIFGVTKEGMTALHVAARARQPGIVGLLLSKIADLDDEKRKFFINQRNTEGSAALHYACCSGRPETVDLLLDAGADPNLPGKNGFTPIRTCAEFEIEQARWKRIGKQETTKAVKTASILLGTRSVPSAGEDPERFEWRSDFYKDESDSTRLDEILSSLVLHGANITGDDRSLRDAFQAAVLNEYDYTAECLVRLQSRFLSNMDLIEGSDGNGFVLCKTRLERKRSWLREIEEKTCQSMPKYAQAMHMSRLLGRREYSMLEEMVPRIDILLLSSVDDVSLLHSLVGAGLSDILARVCTREVALKFDDHEWCRQAEDANHCDRNKAEPLLITACKRELPNMEVVRILVEKMGVDININAMKGYNGLLSGHGILHDLALGATWWKVHQALPYLIGKGANLELRDHNGDTPLHIALDFEKYKRVYYKDAVKILLEKGADVNAVNSKGETCLSKAGTDIELITLLLSYGAKISPAAIFPAIELGNVELLEFFLSQGDLANLRRPAPETPEKFGIQQTRIPSAEVYPLLHAATFKSHGHGQKPDLIPLRMRMMTALLQHGADPYATFTKFYQVNDDSLLNENKLDNVIEDSGRKWEAKTCTVIHEILERGETVEPLLQLPSLQLELRDSQGRTLILSTTECNTIQELAKRGADITAQDKSGVTVVHNLIQCRYRPCELVINTIKALLTRGPNLVHISDNAGDTPLHCVLRKRDMNIEYVDLLLECGANPHQPDSKGNTALHFLAINPHIHKARIQQLLQLGLDINARNKKGNTPLSRYYAHGSLTYGVDFNGDTKTDPRSDPDFLLFFKDLGADFFALNNVGMSLLHEVAGREVSDDFFIYEKRLKAGKENHVRWFKFLMDMGLDPMLEDAQQRTSLDLAAACGNEHILKLFKQRPTEPI